MTDSPQPAHDLDALKLAIVQEIAHQHGDPQQALQVIQSNLETLYQAMDAAGQDTAAIMGVWQQANTMVAQTTGAIDIAAQSRALARDLASKMELTSGTLQRVRDEKAHLEQAVIDADTSHPLVEDLWDSLQEETEVNFLQSGAWVSYCPACDLHENLPDVNHNTAQMFHEMLYDGADLNAMEQAELENFIIEFVRKVADRHENERNQRNQKGA